MSCQPEVFSLNCLRALLKRLEERHKHPNAGVYIFCRVIDRHKISVRSEERTLRNVSFARAM